ncbi:MAG: FMN-binding protein [Spirochaetaceae bacterium]|jgi:fumarate reductase flavoprotein subunit|nr:FMN-binding protein [Spirochaetaceae bacterium]
MKNMKKLLLPALLGFAGCISFQFAERFNAGSYRGEGTGHNGAIVVEVETDSASILDINIIEQHEDALVGGEAMRELKEQILEEDSTFVDAISGATITSEGFLHAVDEALSHGRR